MGDLGGRLGDVAREVAGDDDGEKDHRELESSDASAAAAALGDVHRGCTGLRFMTPGAADPPATWREGKTISGKEGSRSDAEDVPLA